VLDSGAVRPGFKSQPQSLSQTVHTHRASVHQAAKLVAALLRVERVTAGLAESKAVYCRVYDSRHLQADCQVPGSNFIISVSLIMIAGVVSRTLCLINL